MTDTPFRITFTLTRPMRVPEYPIHLDSLLAWARVREAEEAGMESPFDAQNDLPLARDGEGSSQVWCASQLMFQSLAPPQQLMMTKRFEIDAIARARGRVYSGGPDRFTMGTGKYKAFVLNEPIVWTGSVVAYGLGHMGRVRELVGRIHSIGKLRRLMLGRVGTVDVVEDPRASDAWRYRILPIPLPGYHPIEAVIRPPYWDRTRRVLAYAPTSIPGELSG